jgi:LysR family hydrogen peroxide-inducible transcriptional activator
MVLRRCIKATPLMEEKIKEIVLYFEPFAYIPENHHTFQKKEK